LIQAKEYGAAINLVGESIASDRTTLTDPDMKHWLALRWRNLFLNEAVHDTKALDAATGFLDRRSSREKIAAAYLTGTDRDEWTHEMPPAQGGPVKNTTLFFCPGLLNGLLPVRAFQDAFPALSANHGVPVLRADSHPVRGTSANGEDIAKALNKGLGRDAKGDLIPPEKAVSPGNIFLIGYSKGSVDATRFLVDHPEMKERVKAVFFWAGPVGGSPAADDVYTKIKHKDIKKLTDKLDRILDKLTPPGCGEPIDRLDEYDIKSAVRDLTVYYQTRFLLEHKDSLNALGIPMFTLAGSTKALKVPLIQLQSYLSLKKFGANDMQVTHEKTRLPLNMHIPLALLNGHHWDLAYPAFVKRKRLNNMYHAFPKEAAVTAMLLLCAEIGLID